MKKANKMKKSVTKWKYVLINDKGTTEPWTGIFDTLKEANIWYSKYGEFHESNGHEIVLKSFETNN